MSHQDIAYNVTGQTLYLDAREGRASSITELEVHRWDAGDDVASEWSPSGSIDSVNTTFAAASGRSQADPHICNVTSETNVVIGREYLATTSGRREWVRATATATGQVRSRHPLAHDYVSADAFVGTRLSFTVDATWVADISKLSPAGMHHPAWRVRWVYVVSSVTYVVHTYFDLVRYPAMHGVTAQDVDRQVPGFLLSLQRHHQDDQARSFLDEAYRQFRLDLYQEKIDDAAIRDRDVVNDLVTKKAVAMWLEQRVYTGAGDSIAADRARAEYWARFTAIFKAPTLAKAPIATDTGGAGAYKAPARVTVR